MVRVTLATSPSSPRLCPLQPDPIYPLDGGKIARDGVGHFVGSPLATPGRMRAPSAYACCHRAGLAGEPDLRRHHDRPALLHELPQLQQSGPLFRKKSKPHREGIVAPRATKKAHGFRECRRRSARMTTRTQYLTDLSTGPHSGCKLQLCQLPHRSGARCTSCARYPTASGVQIAKLCQVPQPQWGQVASCARYPTAMVTNCKVVPVPPPRWGSRHSTLNAARSRRCIRCCKVAPMDRMGHRAQHIS